MNREFFEGKKVFITGNTGFKGSWLSLILKKLGAIIYGYSLAPKDNQPLYNIFQLDQVTETTISDIRNEDELRRQIQSIKPDFIIHLAAQPLVRESYIQPLETYHINALGTANLLEAIRISNIDCKVLVVTTDKVYENNEWCWGYREIERLNGQDPYSNSKSCAELITYSYNESFFKKNGVVLSTARAGNVIGGGDFAKDRIIPDCVKAITNQSSILLRNPNSVRPYQHVFEPLFAYLEILHAMDFDPSKASSYNVGPGEANCITTQELVKKFYLSWGKDIFSCEVDKSNNNPPESNYLKLDCSKILKEIGWFPKWDINKTVEKTVEWYKCWYEKEDLLKLSEKQIDEYLEIFND